MRSFVISLFAVMALLPTACQAQLFPRLFGSKSTAQVGSACPGGVCPTAAPASTYRSVGVSAAIAAPLKAVQNRAGHWSYPGSIDSHLEGTHGVSTAGMSHQQKLALHDSLHEGTAAPRANYPAVSSSVGYGSSGVRVSGYGSSGSAVGFGSSGSLAVGSVLSDGAVVTSVGVTVAAKADCGCGCPNCTCGGVQSASEPKAMQGIGDLFDRRSDKAAFRKSLFAAIKQARVEGKIDEFQAFAIRGLSWMPGNLEIMQATLHEAAIEDGVASAQAINWEKLIELIIKYLPYILDLFKK